MIVVVNNNESSAQRTSDIVIVNISGGSISSNSGLPMLLVRCHEVPHLVLYEPRLGAIARQALRLGARGTLPTSTSVSTLLLTINAVLAGKLVDPAKILATHSRMTRSDAAAARVARSNVGQSFRSDASKNAKSTLTPRQMQVLEGLSEGKPNKVIARDLEVSENTVKAHLKSVFRILGARNRTEAVSQANRRRLLTI